MSKFLKPIDITGVPDGTAPLLISSTTKVDNLNADKLDDKDGAYYQPRMFTGTCATAIGTAAKTVTLADPAVVPAIGDMFAITMTNGNNVATMTMDINGSGVRNIRMNNTNSNTTFATLVAGAVLLLYFDGTYYQMLGSQRTSDSDTYDRVQWNGTITAGAAIYDYKIIMQAPDGKFYPLTLETGTGTTKTVSTQQFVLNGTILYYASTTDVALNATTASSLYNEIATANLHYTANVSAWTSQLPVYLKGTVDASGYFVLDNTSYTSWLTQTLPSSDDGFVYIMLGYMYSTNSMRFTINHPIYQYKNGAVRPYSPPSTFPGQATLTHVANPYIHLNDGTNQAYLQLASGVLDFNAFTAAMPIQLSSTSNVRIPTAKLLVGSDTAVGSSQLQVTGATDLKGIVYINNAIAHSGFELNVLGDSHFDGGAYLTGAITALGSIRSYNGFGNGDPAALNTSLTTNGLYAWNNGTPSILYIQYGSTPTAHTSINFGAGGSCMVGTNAWDGLSKLQVLGDTAITGDFTATGATQLIGDALVTGTLTNSGQIIQNLSVTNQAYVPMQKTPMLHSTANGGWTYYGDYAVPGIRIASGITNSGNIVNQVQNALRNYQMGGDVGTLSGQLSAASWGYGHYNLDASSPSTTLATGLSIKSYAKSGTITTAYDIQLTEDATGGTVTNNWSIYQESTNKKNFFGGVTLVGTNSWDGVNKLQVAGNIVSNSGVYTGYTTSTTYASFNVRRLDQSGAGNIDQAIVDVGTGTGDARFLQYNNNAGAISNSILLKRDGNTVTGMYGQFLIGTSSPDGTSKLQVEGGAKITGALGVGSYAHGGAGDLTVTRTSASTSGYIYYGSSGTAYLGYDGSDFAISGSDALKVKRVIRATTALASSGTISVDCAVADIFTITPTNTTTLNATNGTDGQEVIIILTSNGSSYNVTFNTGFKSAGVVSTGALNGKVFVVRFIRSAGSLIETSRTGPL